MENKPIQARLREPIIADAEEKGLITSVFLAERLILERGEAADEIARLTSENAELRRVRDWYADEGNYQGGMEGKYKIIPAIYLDAGKRARDSIGQGGG